MPTAKAFDKDDLGKLLQKLSGIEERLFGWIKESLKDRTQTAVVYSYHGYHSKL